MYSPDDAAEFVLVPGIPVLDEHEMSDPKRGLRAVVDAAALREIADNTNRRAVEKRNPCPLIVGHTSDDPQAPERPVVGYASNFRLAPFPPDPTRMALFADFHVRRDRQQVIKDFPRRSVELWWERKEIDPIALLGGTTPERDLGDLAGGQLRYQRERRAGETLFRCSLDDSTTEPIQMAKPTDEKPGDKPKPGAKPAPEKLAATDAPDTTDLPPDAGPKADGGGSGDPLLEKVFSDSRFVDLENGQQEIMSAIQELLQEVKGGGGAPGGKPGEPAPEGDEGDLEPDEGGDEGAEGTPPAGPPGKGPAKPGAPVPEDRKSNEPPPVRLAAGAYPGGTGSVPDFAKPKEPAKMSRATATDAPEVVRLQRRVQELEEANVHAAKRSEAEKLVAALADGTAAGLEGNRIKFSRTADRDSRQTLVEKLTEYLKVDPKLAADEVEEVKLNYAREPIAPADRPAADVAGHARVGSPTADAPSNGIEAQLVADTVLKFQRAGNPITPAEALTKVREARRATAATV